MKRAYQPLLREYLRAFPCVGLIGPRQCGKTTLLGVLPKQFRRYDLERASDLEIVAADPDLFLRLHPSGIAIDEAQALPALFSALRVAIDADRRVRGRYVITGSTSPSLLRSISETLAGRIGVIEMAPLSWAEVRPRAGRSFVSVLLDRQASAEDLVNALRPRGSVRDAHQYWLRGGYPEPWLRKGARFRQLWLEQYVRQYLERDLGRLFPGLDQPRFRLFLRLLGGLSGSILNYSDVARALGVSQPTARDYFEIAHGTFLWRRLPAFTPRALKRLVKHPKGYLRDSGVLHHLLRIGDLDGLLSHPQCGHSWEGMVTEEIVRGLESRGAGHDASFYRTSAGAEIDLVLEGEFGRVACEIKRAPSPRPHALRALRDFVAEHGCRFGVVICNAERPVLLDERIAMVPFTHL